MIKKLFFKEFKLAVPMYSFLFILMPCLLFIPAYPYVVGMIYFTVQLQIVFSIYAANKDLEFTAMLPVSRKDIVRVRFITVIFTQAAHLFVAIICGLISSLILNPLGNQVGMDANFAFFGLILIYYAVFNYIFLTLFYKTGYKWGIPFGIAILSMGILAVACEIIIAFVPFLNEALDSLNPEMFVWQLLVLGLGIIVYISGLVLSFKKAVKNFERVNI